MRSKDIGRCRPERCARWEGGKIGERRADITLSFTSICFARGRTSLSTAEHPGRASGYDRVHCRNMHKVRAVWVPIRRCDSLANDIRVAHAASSGTAQLQVNLLHTPATELTRGVASVLCRTVRYPKNSSFVEVVLWVAWVVNQLVIL